VTSSRVSAATDDDLEPATPPDCGNVGEVFAVFLKLGATSFGGPIAHLGYFRREIVERRGWLAETAYADLVGLCQFLPGPASSQVGFSIGLLRAGLLGGLAAWTAFTLPSALLMLSFALFDDRLVGPVGAALLHGLKLVAVPIVIQAIIAMARTLTPDARRLLIAAAIALSVSLISAPWMQVLAIALGAALGLIFCRRVGETTNALTGRLPHRWIAIGCIVAFALLLLLSLFLQVGPGGRYVAMGATFFRAGALVFGGGHVVLPLLRASMVPHWIDDPTFLAGYGVAQAMPGPLFTFATYLGGHIAGTVGAVVATVSIFLPGALLVTGILPIERQARSLPSVQSALAGVNAAVVGILVAALVTALLPTAVLGPSDVLIAVAGLLLLMIWRLPPLALVILTTVAAMATAWVGWSTPHS
jgi:chromate transporter